MRIALLCATARGLQVLDRLIALAPDDDLVVCSFREEGGEPLFFDALRERAAAAGAHFYETRDVSRLGDQWADGVDLLLATNWRSLVPRAVFESVRRGAYVIHDSVLPAYRGFSPTVWAMVNREREVGATLFAMSEDMDAGDIVDQRRIPLSDEARIGSVIEQVTAAYLELLEKNLPALRTGAARLTAQDHSRATYTCRRLAEDNLIPWDAPTERIYALIRAVTRPYPGAFTWLRNRKLIVWDAQRVDPKPYAGRIPGRIVQILPGSGTVVLTGNGALLLTEVQLEGDQPRRAPEILTGLGMTLRLRADY